MTGVSSDWREYYEIKTTPLTETMNEAGVKMLNVPLNWTLNAQVALETLKQELQTAPILMLRDSSKPFHLYVYISSQEKSNEPNC